MLFHVEEGKTIVTEGNCAYLVENEKYIGHTIVENVNGDAETFIKESVDEYGMPWLSIWDCLKDQLEDDNHDVSLFLDNHS